jgi:hypothetical protein
MWYSPLEFFYKYKNKIFNRIKMTRDIFIVETDEFFDKVLGVVVFKVGKDIVFVAVIVFLVVVVLVLVEFVDAEAEFVVLDMGIADKDISVDVNGAVDVEVDDDVEVEVVDFDDVVVDDVVDVVDVDVVVVLVVVVVLL